MRFLGAITGLFLTQCAIPTAGDLVAEINVDTCIGETCAGQIDTCLSDMSLCDADVVPGSDAGTEACTPEERAALKNTARVCLREAFACVGECIRQMKEDLQ